jgi:hypothetical protein
VAEKKSYFGAAGQLAAMSKFLIRGYNVAIPQVDVGEDVLVVDDHRRCGLRAFPARQLR